MPRRYGGVLPTGSSYESSFFFIVLAFSIVSLTLNYFHHSVNILQYKSNELLHPTILREDTYISNNDLLSSQSHKDVKKEKLEKQENNISTPKIKNLSRGRKDKFDPDHTLAGLSCEAYGGPSRELAEEMVYWSDIQSDAKYNSPFHKSKMNGEEQYMTFEPDGGGWNNIRMAMETVVVLAHAMGRTLVLPPAQGIYLMKKDRKHNVHFTFADFFHLESLANEHSGLDIISMEEYLKRTAMIGKLKNKITGDVEYPPENRTNWDGLKDFEQKKLKEYLRNVTLTPAWRPGSCLAAFPTSTGSKDIEDLYSMLNGIIQDKGSARTYFDDPTPVDSDAVSRMKEHLAGRQNLCVYDEEMQNALAVHMMCYPKEHVRLLTHFYTFVYFEDWKQQMWAHRFVRDHLRYVDELQCAASRVVNSLRDIAKKQTNNPTGHFDTMHIRRGDFQYKSTRLDANELYKSCKEWVPEKSVVFIATDERDKSFFDPFREHYEIYFLDDFKHLFSDLNTNMYGMLDQLIATRGRTFVGTYYSTYTGYINRMRGYHIVKDNADGYDLGKVNSYYFTSTQDIMTHYTSFDHPLFAREFPFAWRDIDKGIDMM